MKVKLHIHLSALLFICWLASVPQAQAANKIYNTGDAVIFNDQIIIGSLNMGNGLEIYKVETKKIVKANTLKSPNAPSGEADNFYDFTFSLEKNKLYAYLVDGRFLYKYDISILSSPTLISKIADNNWDYFMGVAKTSEGIYTKGIKGVKIWNPSGQIIDSYNIGNSFAYNISCKENDLIFNIVPGITRIYNKNTRQYVNQIAYLSEEYHNSKPYNDLAAKMIYMVDDGSLNKFDYNGNLKNTYKHNSNRGYEVDGFADQGHLYFTDGRGVIKFSKDNLKPIKWAYTTELGEKNGWAMGLKVLRDSQGEKIVVFNNSSILLLDQNLKMISHFAATTENIQPREKLFLSLDKNKAKPAAEIILSGGGYAESEDLTIVFAGRSISAKADSVGRFIKVITVPVVEPGKTDLRVVGKYSGLSYSLGFQIE